ILSAADLDAAIIAAGGVDITVSGVTVKGTVRRPDAEALRAGEEDLGAELISSAILVLVPTGSLPALAANVRITVDGAGPKGVRYMVEGAGITTRIVCVHP